MESKAPANSPARLIYYLLFIQFLVQFVSFFYLYVHVQRLEHEMREAQLLLPAAPLPCSAGVDCASGAGQTLHRRRRSSAIPAPEENTLSETFRGRDEKDSSKESKTAPLKGDEWVWLSADTRIPYNAIDTFCRKSSEYCPPGAPGFPGNNGIPGLKGDQGLPGIQGTPGIPGPRGPPGPEGPRGEPGLDGVDGIPGEPGLDGLPGRSGNDGMPGKDGKPGFNGTPGAPGRNGTDGRHGQSGPQGPQGPPGIPGKMGLRGPPGLDGKPGVPSIVAYAPFKNMVGGTITSIDTSDLLVPPSIDGSSAGQITVVVTEEGLNVRLECQAAGKPNPIIQWHRPDGQLIHTGIWHASAIYGSFLNLSSVHRDDMGNYSCTADNGIPPSATKRYKLHVKFGPLIRIRAPVVRPRSQYGSAQLECEVEAFPKPEMHWENKDGRIESKHDKYKIQEEDYRRDKFKMKLKILKIGSSDYGGYHCVARNSITSAKGTVTLKDPNDKLPSESKAVAIFGKLPPPRPQYRSLCPPQLSCESCPRANCGDAPVEARPMTGVSFSGMPPRIADGVIGAVGIAVFKGQTDDLYGVWMQDASPKSEASAGKLWVTRSNDTLHIYEYAAVEDYGKKKTPRSIKLPYPFQGNGHLVHDGYFFYNPYNRSSIVRLDLTHSEGTMYAYGRVQMELPGLRINSGNYLYTPNHNFNYVDFDIDENGLWAIYGTPTNGTVVMKVNPANMLVEYAWSITVDHHKYGEMFVARGVLYAVHSVTDKTMNISLAVDLYDGKQVDVSLSFVNAYQKVTVLKYNSKTKELYAWDKGSLLAYQVRYNETHLNTD